VIDLAKFPRVSLAHLPTPLEPLPRLSQELGGPAIWLKRDDCTGLATGGNKARKLEFLMGEALARNADTILCFGALQSNHVRQTAAAAARLGLACHAILSDVVRYREPAYEVSGNRLLDELLGASVHVVADAAAAGQVARELIAELERQGRTHYAIPVGGSSAVGALGYVGCANELWQQARDLGIRFSAIAHATSSAGTQAGLLAGFAGLKSDIAVRGFNVYSDDPAGQRAGLARLCDEVCGMLGIAEVARERLEISSEFIGEGYGEPTTEALRAIRLMARCEGILLDPVYSGKAMAGLIETIRRGDLPADDPVVFLHTGGAPGIFAYREALAREL
jgi:L-cysteate sulfo-lyase